MRSQLKVFSFKISISDFQDGDLLTSGFTSFPATSGGPKSAILPEITQYVYIYTLSIYGMT